MNPKHDKRASLTGRSIEKIEMAFVRAIDRGDPDPVVLVVDLTDPLGLEIARRLGGADRAMRMLSEPMADDVSPLVIVGIPATVACRVAEDLIPGLSDTIVRKKPDEGFVAITVAAEGARLTVLPPVFS